MGFEDEVEQSFGRPCRQCDGRSKQTYDLTSSIVPRGTSFHRWVELDFPPIAFDPAQISSCCDFPGPSELGAVNPHAVHDHGQPTRQRHDRLFHPAMPGDLHRPGLEPGPFAIEKRVLVIPFDFKGNRSSGQRTDVIDFVGLGFAWHAVAGTLNTKVMLIPFPGSEGIAKSLRTFRFAATGPDAFFDRDRRP